MVFQFRGQGKFSIFVSVSIRTQDRGMNVPTEPPPLMKIKNKLRNISSFHIFK